MKTAVLGVLTAIIIVLFLPYTIPALQEFRTESIDEDHTVATAAGVTTANITLSQELYDDRLDYVDLTSSVATDVAAASSYNSATRALAITGLTANTTRLMTVDYRIDGLEDYMGSVVAYRILPVLIVLGIIGLLVAAVYNATKHNE